VTAEQAFVTRDGYRVVDWRPAIGPPERDRAFRVAPG
jgi:hypothetical protein